MIKSCLVCFESGKYAFGVNLKSFPEVHGEIWAAPVDQPQSSTNPKIFLIEVVRNDSLMIKIASITLTVCPQGRYWAKQSQATYNQFQNHTH